MVAGLKTIIGALLKSLRMLTDVILLTLFCMMIFALFAIQVYIGVLRQKCVRDPVETMSDSEYLEYVKDPGEMKLHCCPVLCRYILQYAISNKIAIPSKNPRRQVDKEVNRLLRVQKCLIYV